MVAVLALVFTFESSIALAFAFGMAVTGTITITTLLFFYIARHQWRWPLWLRRRSAAAFLLIVDLLFLAANSTKIAHGAWLPLLIARRSCFAVLTTWQRGREIVTARREREEGSLRRSSTSCTRSEPPRRARRRDRRVPQPQPKTAPLAMRASVEHLHALHEHVVILTIETQPVPHVPPADRLRHRRPRLPRRRHHPRDARFGYMDRPNVPRVLRLIQKRATSSSTLDVATPSYFLSDGRAAPGRRRRACRAGASASSSRCRASRPTPPSTSTCRAIRP